MMETIANLSTPILIVLGVGAFFFMIRQVAKMYVKVSPNEVAVVSGRKYRIVVNEQPLVRGYKTIKGGGFFLIPFFEKMESLSLALITFQLEVKSAPDLNGALVNVVASVNIRIRSEDEFLALAIERFVGRPMTEISDMAKQNLEGNLRAIIGTLSIEDLIKDRAKLQSAVMTNAGVDLGKLGLSVELLTVKEVSDPRGYIEAIGKKQTAEIVAAATIGEAEAKRESDTKSAQARQAGEIAVAKSEQEISNAEMDRDKVVAENKAIVASANARVEINAQTAAAEATKALNEANVAAEVAQAEAETTLQASLQKRNKAEQEATTIVIAEAQKQSKIIGAEADQEAARLQGEAERIKQEKLGQGVQARQIAEAIGRKAIAEAVEAEGAANAAAEKAMLLAKAEGLKSQLLAEAEGTLKKAQAFKELDEAGRFLMIIEALPAVIEAMGNAGSKILTPFGEAIGQGLGNVDEIRLIDMGGGNGQAGSGGKNVLGQFMNVPVETIFNVVQKAEASGMMPMIKTMAKRFGFDVDGFLGSLPKVVDSELEKTDTQVADKTKTAKPDVIVASPEDTVKPAVAPQPVKAATAKAEDPVTTEGDTKQV